MQSRIESLIETIIDLGIGFIIAWQLTLYLSNYFDISNSAQAFYFTIVFTIVSVIRKYSIRRIFNFLLIKRINNQ